MLTWRTKLWAWFSPPQFSDDSAQRRASVLWVLLLSVSGALLLALFIGVPFIFIEKPVSTFFLLSSLMVVLIGWGLLKTKRLAAASIFILLMLWLITTSLVCLSGGLRSYYVFFYLSGIPIAGILFNTYGASRYTLLSIVSLLGLGALTWAGVDFPQLFKFPTGAILFILLINIGFVMVPLNINLREMAFAIKQARQEVVERQHTEHALRENQTRLAEREERYRLISTVTSDYMFSTQLNAAGSLELEWIAGAFESITGYTLEEYVARGGWLAALHPDDREKDALDIATLHTNKPVISEVRTLSKNGDVHWVRVYAHPLWDEPHQKLRGIYGAVQEITKQKQAELEREQHAQEIFVLYKLGHALAAGKDLYQTLYNLLAEIRALFAMDLFYVGIYEPELGLVNFPLFFSDGQIRQVESRNIKQQRGLSGEIVLTGKTVFLNDLQEPLVRQRYEPIPTGGVAESRSFIGVPLIVRDRVFGLISVQSRQPNFYNYGQVHLLETIAIQAAVFIERALLVDQLQRELLERTRAEAQVQESLQEKELLLKEVHHRVKNNLQVIVSLINLQTAQLTDERSLQALRESQNRVRSMALVHEKLYQSQNLARLDFREYLHQLASTLFHSYQAEATQVDLQLDIAEVTLEVDQAIPCGLIVNELVSNALKHAFPNGRSGTITLTLHTRTAPHVELAVTDNGVGLPVELTWQQTESLGMQLVQSLVKQIGGDIQLERLTPGTRFTLRFNHASK
jgi:PAS domain S-box-containing protein